MSKKIRTCPCGHVLYPDEVIFCQECSDRLSDAERIDSIIAEIESYRNEQQQPHPDYCLCDCCAAERFAYCGYED